MRGGLRSGSPHHRRDVACCENVTTTPDLAQEDAYKMKAHQECPCDRNSYLFTTSLLETTWHVSRESEIRDPVPTQLNRKKVAGLRHPRTRKKEHGFCAASMPDPVMQMLQSLVIVQGLEKPCGARNNKPMLQDELQTRLGRQMRFGTSVTPMPNGRRRGSWRGRRRWRRLFHRTGRRLHSKGRRSWASRSPHGDADSGVFQGTDPRNVDCPWSARPHG